MATQRPSDPEPIAIVGMSCRFSGTACDEHGLWKLLAEGSTTWASNAKDRFNMESFYHPSPQMAGSSNVKGLHLLDQDLSHFDNIFFGISGTEAKAIDPNQRLLLEVVYEAFENAGFPLDKLEGSNTGVYCAGAYVDYDQIQGRDSDTSASYRFTGTGPSIMSNRISYTFDLHGPSLTVDTACSSALVGLHHACRAIWSGEVDQAVVGASNLIMDPDKLADQSSMTFLSADGRCYAFDSRASGYGRGDGVGALIVKPLHAALRDGDTIRSVIRGTAVASDGKTFGITLPSGDAQYRTIKKAYEFANMDPGETLFVEAHGTGTTAGDSAEVSAFTRAFCASRSISEKLYVGSVKSNIGHTEQAAGLPALFKAFLMLEREQIVPNPTFKTPNPILELEKSGIIIPTETIEWPKDAPRRVSVHNTGYGGTNAHIILESGKYWQNTLPESPVDGKKLQVFAFSHQQEQGIRKLAGRWAKFLTDPNPPSLSDLAFTLGSRRSPFSYRSTIKAASLDELVSGLQGLENGSVKSAKTSAIPDLCFVFTGQGAQWATMSKELISHYPVFRESILKAEEALIKLGAPWKLTEELGRPEDSSRINEPELAQPCTTAIQVALTDLLDSFGVRPSKVCGHSSGEIGAAYALGSLSAFDAVKVAFHRGCSVNYIRDAAPELKGGMLAVGLSEEKVQDYLAVHDEKVRIGCVNSSNSITLTGDAVAIDELQTTLTSLGVFNRRLAVSVGYHSHHMKVIEDFYHDKIKAIEPQPGKPGITMVSSVTGEAVKGEDLGANYWVQNLVSPVLFSAALSQLVSNKLDGAENSAELVIEIGPQAALRSAILRILTDAGRSDISYLSCLKRKQDSAEAVIALAGELFCRGAKISLNNVNLLTSGQNAKNLTQLPSYNWQHEASHWNESRRSRQYRFKKFPRHDLLGSLTPDSIETQPLWKNYFRLSTTPWLEGYQIDGSILISAAGYLSMVVEAMHQRFQMEDQKWRGNSVQFKGIEFTKQLMVPTDATGVEVFLQMRPRSKTDEGVLSTWQEFQIFSVSMENQYIEHCHGAVRVTSGGSPLSQNQTSAASSMGWTRLERDRLYETLDICGMKYSGPFAGIKSILARPWESNVEVTVSDVRSTMPSRYQQPHTIHPTTLEAFIQAAFPGLKLAGHLQEVMVPVSIDEMCISTDCLLRAGEVLTVKTRSANNDMGRYSSEIYVKKRNNAEIVQMKGVNFRELSSSQVRLAKKLCYKTEWQLDPISSTEEAIFKHCHEHVGAATQKLRKQLEPTCRHFIKDALRKLRAEEEKRVTGFKQHYLNWMRHYVEGETESSVESVENIQNLGAIGECILQIGPVMKDILVDDADGLSIILGGKGDLFSRLYTEREGISRCHQQAVEYMKPLLFKNPNLRILEVGGGTGSLTFPVVEGLYAGKDAPATPNFTFTDISAGFFGPIKERLGKLNSFVELKTYNIENPAEEQGFELASYDLIIGSNVVHATESIQRILTSLRTLLKPGGQLGLVESTTPTLHESLIFGTLSGWWLGVPEGRTLSPLLQPSQWDKVMKDSGYVGLELQIKDYDDVAEENVSFLLSSSAVAPTETTQRSVVSVLTAEKGDTLGNELVSCINKKYPGTEVVLLPFDAAKTARGTAIIAVDAAEGDSISQSKAIFERVQEAIENCDSVLIVRDNTKNVSIEPKQSLVTGLCRALRNNNQDLRLYTLDIDSEVASDAGKASDILQVYSRIVSSEASPYSHSEWEVTSRNGSVFIPRMIRDNAVGKWVTDSVSKYHPRKETFGNNNASLELKIRKPGSYDTLYWADRSTSQASTLEPSEVTIQLEYAALNESDASYATGRSDKARPMITEGAGVVTAVGDLAKASFSVGDRVCCFEPKGLQTVPNVNYKRLCRIPDTMDSEIAASVPISYATVLYSLQIKAAFEAGETVLIHCAGSAMGQAAITIARYLGAGNVFLTVENEEQRDALRSISGVAQGNILDCDSLTLENDILKATNNLGVDVVLNLPSKKPPTSLCGLLSKFGRFVDLGTCDSEQKKRTFLELLDGNKSFFAVDLAQVAESRPDLLQKLITGSLDLLEANLIRNIEPITVSSMEEAPELFELMQDGQSVGKLMLEIDLSLPIMTQAEAPPLPQLAPQGLYLVAGKLGGIGEEVVRHFAKLGAKKIVALTDSENASDEAAGLIEEMQSWGVTLGVIEGAVDDHVALDYISQASKTFPLKGVIYNGSSAQWAEGLSRQASGTKNLLKTVSTLGTADFFIMMGKSSVVTGSPVNYADTANAEFVNSLARQHAAQGLPFRVLNVGQVTEVISENDSDREETEHSLAEFLAALNHAIRHPIASSENTAEITLQARPKDGSTAKGISPLEARLSHLLLDTNQSSGNAAENGSGKAKFDMLKAVKSASTTTEAIDVISTGLKAKVAQLLNISANDIQLDQTVVSYGVDSLIELQLRNWIVGHVEANVTMAELMGSSSMHRLAEIVAHRSGLVKAGLFPAA